MDAANLTTLEGPLSHEPPVEYLARRYGYYILAFAACLCAAVLKPVLSRGDRAKAPLAGKRSRYEPEWMVAFRFIRDGASMIQAGYDEFKHTVFRVRRLDGDLFIVPSVNLEKLHKASSSDVNGLQAHIKNLCGSYSTTDMMLDSDLPTRVIQQRLTTSLKAIVPRMKEELEFALQAEMPACDDEWVPVQMFDLLCAIINRISARVFLGPVTCRSEEWLSLSMQYTENVHTVVMTMRMIPSVLHPLLAPLIPAYWRVRASLAAGKTFLRPIVNERRASRARRGTDDRGDAHDDMLEWMFDLGRPEEVITDKLAHRQLLMSLAATHTTGVAAAHVIYDLCADPELLCCIREEITSSLRSCGGWQRALMHKFWALDSVMKESQRVSPPAHIAFNRINRVPLELADGTTLPPGTHFCMASKAIAHDPANLPRAGKGGEASALDPLRWLRLRQDPSDPNNAHRHQFTTTDSTSLHFGHGRFACPGRFFASQLIKMILGHLLLRYDIKYPEGEGRPSNMTFGENVYPSPMAKVLIRRRELVPEEAQW